MAGRSLAPSNGATGIMDSNKFLSDVLTYHDAAQTEVNEINRDMEDLQRQMDDLVARKADRQIIIDRADRILNPPNQSEKSQ